MTRPTLLSRRLLLIGLAAVAGGLVLLPAAPASAHPLGNFSINEYVGLTIARDEIRANAIVDIAEIPTLQDRPSVDSNSDGTSTDAERAAHAAATCAGLARAVEVRVGHDALRWTVASSDFRYTPGAGGLDVSRLTCGLNVAATTVDRQIFVANTYLADRIGWREMTATATGVALIDSPLPTTSVSGELTSYPADLLSSALDVRSATLTVHGGASTSGVAVASLTGGGDPISRWMANVDRRFQDLAGGPNLTPLVGLLAVALALLLGAGHAALPGHGKTVFAAYLAGRRGRPRDALTVAATVTLTHTGGVLILGLALTAGSRFAGERVLGWLGLLSGLLVLAVGATMLIRTVRARLRHRAGIASAYQDHHGHGGHSHGGHGHGGQYDEAHQHGHHHSHDHSHSHGEEHKHGGEHGHSRTNGHSHAHGGSGRWGLVSVGVAGGLVPSPSALVVLLAAIGLGRTGFGIILVLAYGAGMAATLAGAGLLLLLIQRRLQGRRPGVAIGAGWRTTVAALTRRAQRLTPIAMAALVFAVGLGLALRAVAAIST